MKIWKCNNCGAITGGDAAPEREHTNCRTGNSGCPGEFVNTGEVLNYTGHPVTLSNAAGLIEFPVNGMARIVFKERRLPDIGGLPVIFREASHAVKLPKATPSTYYIVSGYVRNCLPERDDLLVPGACSAEKDSFGNVLSVPYFIANRRELPDTAQTEKQREHGISTLRPD